MNRPKDIHGNQIEMGPWYWARNRRGDVIGTGKFAVSVGHDECTFFVNDTGYAWDSFSYLRVDGSPTLDFVKPKDGEQTEPVDCAEDMGLRQEYERLRELTHKLIEGRGAIVSSADCSPMELAFARTENRFVVDADGMGFVVRLKEWRENAEANASAASA